jgi:hypothetical protein
MAHAVESELAVAIALQPRYNFRKSEPGSDGSRCAINRLPVDRRRLNVHRVYEYLISCQTFLFVFCWR